MSDAVIEIGAVAEDRIAVASNWKLVWWRFRKHRLAVFSAVVLAVFYLVVLCPDFFSTQSHPKSRADRCAPGLHSSADAASVR
jgi:peptide/nickel transport system permease protein